MFAMNLHIFACGAAWALPLFAAWATAPPYRQAHPCEPLAGMGTPRCMTSAAQVSTPERENLGAKPRRLSRETMTLHGIGLNTDKYEHSSEASTSGWGPGHDYDEDRPARREPDPRNSSYGPILHYHLEQQDLEQREEDHGCIRIQGSRSEPEAKDGENTESEAQMDDGSPEPERAYRCFWLEARGDRQH